MKILLTSGGTREPIDGVRFISNFSSGSTGAGVANRLRAAGHNVTYLHGLGAQVPIHSGENIKFETFEDLASSLQKLLNTERFDLVIHMAAVSDYRVDAISMDGKRAEPQTSLKIPSTTERLDLHLKKNKKLLPLLRSWSLNPSITVVGFKLTKNADTQARLSAVERLFAAGNVDWVIHNDLTEITKSQHHATVYGPLGLMGTAATKEELEQKLLEICEGSNKGALS